MTAYAKGQTALRYPGDCFDIRDLTKSHNKRLSVPVVTVRFARAWPVFSIYCSIDVLPLPLPCLIPHPRHLKYFSVLIAQSLSFSLSLALSRSLSLIYLS